MRNEEQLIRRGAANFEEAVGGRDNLVDVLATSARDTKQDILFRLLNDPSRSGDSLIKLCKDSGVTAHEVMSMFRDAVLAKGMVAAQMSMAEKLGLIAQDVAEKAHDHTKPCGCTLVGNPDTANPQCDLCRGTGEIYKEGSLDHAKAVFDATGLTQKGGGVNVNVQQNNVNGNSGGALLDKFVNATDEAAFDVVDAESFDE